MFVGGECLSDATFAHEDEADGIAERVRFILARLHEFNGYCVQRLVNSNNFDSFVGQNGCAETQNFFVGQPPH
jgi:hypothetical protein